MTVLDLREARAAITTRPAATLAPPAAERTLEAASPVLFYGQPGSAESGFRRITSPGSIRDLTPPMQERMQQVAYFLWVTNPLAKRVVEIVTDFVVGEGVTLEAEDPAVQEVLDRFWADPVNAMEQNLEASVSELSVFGEQVMVAAVNPVNGAVRLGAIDPAEIESVEYGTLAALPGRAVAMPVAVNLRRGPLDRANVRLAVIRRDEDPLSPTFGQLAGDCFYWPIGKARAGSRGISLLFASADWIDGQDQMLFALMKQVDALSRFVWDVALTGATGDEIKAWLKENGTPPASGSIRAHNEKVQWSAVAPSVNAGDKTEAVRRALIHVLGGMGIPEYWFASGDAANRATAAEQGTPTLKMLTRRQRFERARLRQIAEYVIERAVVAGALPPNVNRAFAVNTPELSAADMQKAATALQAAAGAMVQFQSARVMDEETMARAAATLLSQMGVEADAATMLAKAREEADARDLRDYTLAPPPGGAPDPAAPKEAA